MKGKVEHKIGRVMNCMGWSSLLNGCFVISVTSFTNIGGTYGRRQINIAGIIAVYKYHNIICYRHVQKRI